MILQSARYIIFVETQPEITYKWRKLRNVCTSHMKKGEANIIRKGTLSIDSLFPCYNSLLMTVSSTMIGTYCQRGGARFDADR